MNPARHVRRGRPGVLLVGESLLLAFVLTATSGLTAGSSLGEPGASGEATAEASVEPSPTAGTEPPASTFDAATPEPTATIEPPPAPEPTIDPAPTPSAEPSETPGPTAEPTPAPTVPPLGLHVDHAWVDVIDRRTGATQAGALDVTASGAERGRIYVVRFRVVNDSDAAVRIRPSLEFGLGESPTIWRSVPAVDPIRGLALYTSANVLRGEDPGTFAVAVEDLRLPTGPRPGDAAVAGIANAGVNPAPPLTLAAHGYTEVSFTVRATASAAWLTTYALRMTDDGQAVEMTVSPALELGGRPLPKLTPGQRSGIDVPAADSTRTASPLTGGRDGGPLLWPLAAAATFITPHADYTLSTDKCAACHATHTAQGPLLANQPAPQANLCLTCHDGSGAIADVKAAYDDPLVPPNDPDTAAWYSHPALTATSHVNDRDEAEFEGRLNRHSACADCHQPHRSDTSPALQTSAGWTASGALLGASGVAVTNGAAGTEPAYAWARESAFEYQLCFKCHSGFTELLPQTDGPSTWALDKAVELNPANLSYHPVEAPGTNTTTRMANSLGGTSPYKLWNFETGSTIRCLNCHGDARKADPLDPPDPGGALAPHAVANRSMLIANLRDRVLKNPSDAYEAGDFALCYVCHAEAPFVDTSQNGRLDTGFPVHGTHTAAIASFSEPLGGTVDDDGAGLGNAICAECHFRTHGTTYAVDGQDPERRLVNFAPNVQPYGGPDAEFQGVLDYDDDGNTCTLRCHGVDHGGWSY